MCYRRTAEEMRERDPYTGPVLNNIKAAYLTMIITEGTPKAYTPC